VGRFPASSPHADDGAAWRPRPGRGSAPANRVDQLVEEVAQRIGKRGSAESTLRMDNRPDAAGISGTLRLTGRARVRFWPRRAYTAGRRSGRDATDDIATRRRRLTAANMRGR